MRVAVCCPGPSLPRTWPSAQRYDAVWAVNRALLVVEADWLSAGDLPLFNGLLPDGRLPRRGVISMADTIREISGRPDWARLTLHAWEEHALMREHEAAGRPISWSVQAALCHAAGQGATVIDLFGCDGARSGTVIDCTGYRGEDRSAHRWAREEQDLAVTVGILAARGVAIFRLPPLE